MEERRGDLTGQPQFIFMIPVTDLAESVAIVTGAARGLGHEYALLLAHDGAKVAVVDVNNSGAESTAREIREKGQSAITVPVDVRDERSTIEMAQRAYDQWGRIDILVNNAAIWGDLERSALMEVSSEHLDLVMGVYLAIVPCATAFTKRQVPSVHLEALVNMAIIKRPGTAEDIYSMIRYLASKEAGWITGQTFLVNGGFSVRL
jgi:NAD(P)-dependent dehydrogenase (short-subunit alcohol dehydrogenase family)